jgi:hypothetical protein
MSSSRYVIPESTTEVYYPASKRKKIVDHKGEVIYDSTKAKDQEKGNDKDKDKQQKFT